MRAEGVGVCVPVGSKVLVGMGVDMGVDMGVAVGAHLEEEGWNEIEVEGGFEAWVSAAVEPVAGGESEVWVAGPAGQASEKLSWLRLPTSRQQQAQTPDATHSRQQSTRKAADTVLLQLVAKAQPASETSRHAVVCAGQHGFHIIQLTNETSR